MKAKAPLVALFAAMVFTAASHAGGMEQEVLWADVPAAVQKTITENAGGGTVRKIEKETKAGKVAYEAEITKADGTEVEIKVGEDGKVIEIEND
jgi:hypothetical protein